MNENIPMNHHWLEERFNHINTILGHIRETVDHLRETQAEFMNRCSTQMADLSVRVQKAEHNQAVQLGYEENHHRYEASQNLRWQMIIAIGTAISGAAAFVGYFMGKG
jgi:hypothetical protein